MIVSLSYIFLVIKNYLIKYFKKFLKIRENIIMYIYNLLFIKFLFIILKSLFTWK